jgi:predicted RNase H-like HicB family nuclease
VKIPEVTKYLIVIEPTEIGYSAFSPDLDGCVAAGATIEEVERRIHEAIEFHIEGLRSEGLEVPQPKTRATYVTVAA